MSATSKRILAGDLSNSEYARLAWIVAKEVERLEAQVEKANRLLEIGDRMAATLLTLDTEVQRVVAENARLEARVKELERRD